MDSKRPVPDSGKSGQQNPVYANDHVQPVDSTIPAAQPPGYSPQTPIKTFTITNLATINPTSRQSITLNEQPIILVNRKAPIFGRPTIILHQAATNAILAACRLRAVSSNMRFVLGDPDATPEHGWADINSETFTHSKFKFPVVGGDGAGGVRQLMWTRTHDKSLGARKLGNQDFKLADASGGRLLAVFIRGRTFSRSGFGRVEWFEELGNEVELSALAVILGIEEQIRRRDNAAGAGSAAGAGA